MGILHVFEADSFLFPTRWENGVLLLVLAPWLSKFGTRNLISYIVAVTGTDWRRVSDLSSVTIDKCTRIERCTTLWFKPSSKAYTWRFLDEVIWLNMVWEARLTRQERTACHRISHASRYQFGERASDDSTTRFMPRDIGLALDVAYRGSGWLLVCLKFKADVRRLVVSMYWYVCSQLVFAVASHHGSGKLTAYRIL